MEHSQYGAQSRLLLRLGRTYEPKSSYAKN